MTEKLVLEQIRKSELQSTREASSQPLFDCYLAGYKAWMESFPGEEITAWSEWVEDTAEHKRWLDGWNDARHEPKRGTWGTA